MVTIVYNTFELYSYMHHSQAASRYSADLYGLVTLYDMHLEPV